MRAKRCLHTCWVYPDQVSAMRCGFVGLLLAASACGRLDYGELSDASGSTLDSDDGIDAPAADATRDTRVPMTDACPGCRDAAGALGDPCAADASCASGHCADGMCCNGPCDGNCDQCVAGMCEAVPAACLALCSSAVCTGDGIAFACDISTCCSTGSAPNFTGRCGQAVDVLVGNGCTFEYDYNNCCIPTPRYIEVEWDVQQCVDGAWVSIDSGADAYSCRSCADSVTDSWTDSCGDRSANRVLCP